MLFARSRVLVATLLLLVLAAGCGDRPPITSYKVDKPAPLKPLANPHDAGLPMTLPGSEQAAPPTGDPTDRTLAAIVPSSPQGWFFKLTGPEAAVAAQEQAFTDFLKSVKFVDNKPEWTLPDGWQAQPGNAFRFATLVIPGEKPLELTVSGLPNAGDDNQKYLLDNINRWRGQLRMPPITAEQLSSETTQLDLNGAAATVVNLAGHAAPNTMGRGPFSGATNGN